jgi:DNA repair protein RecO (recombination protein O)
MSRDFSCRVLVLRTRPQGESNREVTFLAEGEGILQATVFGGPQSRLRAHAAPYHEGTAWFYRNPVKNFIKLSDFDVRNWRAGLRETWPRSMTAAAVAETLIASHGGGGAWNEALEFASSLFDALETSDESAARDLLVFFLWKWTEMLGLRPGLDRCASCGEDKTGVELLYWSDREGQTLCPFCAGTGFPEQARNSGAEFLPLHAGTRRWLETIATVAPGQFHRYSLEKTLEGEAKTFVTALVAGAIGRRLSTWNF